MLEIDLHLTKDEKVVVSHDNNLFRVTGVDVNISDANYKDLPPLKCHMNKDLCKVLGDSGKEKRIPLLRDVFEKFPQVAINIDIKVNNDTLISKVNDLIKEYNRESITVWGNFSNDVTKKCYNLNQQIPIYFSAKRVFFLVFLTYNGLLPFVPLRESCLELLMPSVILKLLMRKALFDHLSKRGIQTYFWVLNDEEDFERAFELGATANAQFLMEHSRASPDMLSCQVYVYRKFCNVCKFMHYAISEILKSLKQVTSVGSNLFSFLTVCYLNFLNNILQKWLYCHSLSIFFLLIIDLLPCVLKNMSDIKYLS
ncbi:unnamed protein product [Larinioides sclopetarius]